MTRIYVLSNPITNDVFYVGATKKELNERLKAHYLKVHEVKRGGINMTKRLEYLINLLPNKANIVEIDRCEDDKADELEKYYINEYSKITELTNQTIGGIGGNTFKLASQEQQIKTGELISKQLKGKSKPEGFAENLSNARMGYGNPRAGKTVHPPIVLESNEAIIIFRNGVEANSYFDNKYCWGNLVLISKHNKIHSNKHCYLKTYYVNFVDNCNDSIKDIVESLLEKEGNCYVFDKYTKEITIK